MCVSEAVFLGRAVRSGGVAGVVDIDCTCERERERECVYERERDHKNTIVTSKRVGSILSQLSGGQTGRYIDL